MYYISAVDNRYEVTLSSCPSPFGEEVAMRLEIDFREVSIEKQIVL